MTYQDKNGILREGRGLASYMEFDTRFCVYDCDEVLVNEFSIDELGRDEAKRKAVELVKYLNKGR